MARKTKKQQIADTVESLVGCTVMLESAQADPKRYNRKLWEKEKWELIVKIRELGVPYMADVWSDDVVNDMLFQTTRAYRDDK
jgi:hypothetical protein